MNITICNNKNINLTKYINYQLDTLNYKNSNEKLEKEKNAKKCLQDIGKSLGQYTNFHHILNEMSDNAIRELSDAICDVQFHRKRFTNFVSCSREEADKPADSTRTKGYFTYGENGGEYGYFKHIRKLTDQEEVWLNSYTECCYYNGQPCERWQDENGNDDEDCECVLGREYTSLILNELDIEEEKQLGVWQQDITWTLNGYGGENPYCYFSLVNLKKDTLGICDHKNKNKIGDCNVCHEIMLYDGKKSWSKGNIKIEVLNNNED